MFLKIVFVSCAIAFVFAAPPVDVVPLEKQQPTVIPIVSQSDELEADGTYKYSYETGNGIKREETAYEKVVPKLEGRSASSNEGGESDESNEIHVQRGSYSYTAPDGTLISVSYIADENGFQPVGDHIPRVPGISSSSSNSAEKSGRALKSADSAESASLIKESKVQAKSVPQSSAPEAVATAKLDIPKATEKEPTSTSGPSSPSTNEASQPNTASDSSTETVARDNEVTTAAQEKQTESPVSTAAPELSSTTEASGDGESPSTTTLANEQSSTEANEQTSTTESVQPTTENVQSSTTEVSTSEITSTTVSA